MSREIPGPDPEISGPCASVPTAVFYPEDGNYGPAREVCEGCPARMPCLEHALSVREPDGMWGGMDPPQRRRILRRRRAPEETGQGVLDVGVL